MGRRDSDLCMNDKNCLARDRMEGGPSGGLDFEDFTGFLAVVVEGFRKGVKGWRWAVKRWWMPVRSTEDSSLERREASAVELHSIAAPAAVVVVGGRRCWG